MSPHVKSLLEELYLLEPSLKEKEDAIIRIIETMLAHKPEITIDETFRLKLREKIIEEIARSEKQKHSKTFSFPSWIFPTFSTAFACLAVWIYVFTTTGKYDAPITIKQTSEKWMVSFVPTIRQVEKQGFGSVDILQVRQSGNIQTAMDPVSSEAMSAKMANVEYSNTTVAGWASVSPGGMSVNDTSIAMMLPGDSPVQNEMTVYSYAFSGSLPSLPASMNVYRKNASSINPEETRSMLSHLSIEGIRISALEDAGVTSINISENRASGYAVGIDFTAGSISFFQNWLWPQAKCDANRCDSPRPLTKDDIPSDEMLISIANAFFEKYGIDRGAYGIPVLTPMNPVWMSARPMGGIAESMMIADQITITYPLLLDDKPVYEEWGTYKGINVTIDIRSRKVSGLYGLERQNLDSSLYDTLTNTESLQTMIENGGRYNYGSVFASYEWGPKIVKKTLPLWAPSIAYVHLYGEWKDGKMDEYYVPAYVFQVLEKPSDAYIQDRVIIPIIAEFAKPSSMIMPMPMPAVEPMMMK